MITYEQAVRKLAEYGQSHVLRWYEELDDSQKQGLLGQIESTDFSVLKYSSDRDGALTRGVITPLGAMETAQIAEQEEAFTEAGIRAIREGKTAAVLLAGGMGTRLGSEDPKCMYDIGLTRPVYIMQRLIENLTDVVRQAGAVIPLFIMTSEKNHEKTVKFMEEMDYFGYDRSKVWFFMQDMAPASDYDGKVFMEEKDRIATSPNGNGGWFLSMKKAGLVEKLHELGIEWLDIFAVDNVLQRICDPCFVGATILSGCSVGAKVVRKAFREERVGTICLEDGRPSIVEYYEMTPELLAANDEKGDPAYNFGVIMNYLFKESELERIVDERLPMHVVEKKIPHIDENGVPVRPDAPNGCKYEQLVLDMVHEMESCLPYEVVREKEFAPIKNPTGVDSVESARELCALNGIAL